jgi:hypothetical protein
VAGDGNDERRLALSVEPKGRLVAETSAEDESVHREEVVGAETEGLV